MKNMSSWIQSVNLNLTIIAPHALEKIIQKFMYEENTVEPTQVAPGQGKIPKSILHEKDFDVKSFPCLFPDGKNGKDYERNVPLKEQDYWVQRILNVDDRCGNCPPYVFMAAAHTELKQMN